MITTDTAAGAQEQRGPGWPKLTAGAAIVLVIGLAGGYAAAQPQVNEARAEATALADDLADTTSKLNASDANLDTVQAQLTEASATVEILTAGLDPVVLQIDFPMPPGYPQLVDIGTVPEHMQRALDTGTGQVVAVAPGVWAAFPPGATVESAVNAKAFDGYCASNVAFEGQYLGGQSTSGRCW